MSSLFRSRLLVQDSPNADLRNLVTSLGLRSTHDLTARRRATLTLRGDTAVLSMADPRDFFTHVLYAAQTSRKSIHAVATAPARDLRQIHGRVFFAAAAHVQVTCGAAFAPWDRDDDPYYRRHVELKFVGTELQRSFDTRGTEVVATAEPQGYPLILDPLPITLDEPKLQRLLIEGARALAGINGLLLPPVRDQAPGTYFESAPRLARRSLAAATGMLTPAAALPAAAQVWRSLDDPMLRDIFLDGGSMDVIGETGEPTSTVLNVWGDGALVDVLADYRARMLLGRSSFQATPWARAVAEALAADALDAAPPRSEMRAADRPRAWDTATPPRPFDAGGRESGSWQRIADLSRRLETTTPERAAIDVLQQRVLFPSRSRAVSFADHDLAEREFIRHLWRCPSLQAIDAAWRLAFLDLLKNELTGVHPTPEARVQAWMAGGHFEYRAAEDYPEVIYPASASADDVRRWRLTVPLGTVFKPDANVRLDDGFSRLDRGYRLA